MGKILLVNNVQTFLERNKSLLNRADLLIFTATSAMEALQTHREQKVDLIITKLDMPEMGGDRLCSQIRQENELRNVSIILVCHDTQRELERASSCGANVLVTRPVRPELLLEKVEKLLKISARRDYRAIFKALVHGVRGDLTFSGVTHNISVSGVLCEAKIPLDQNDLIKCMSIAIGAHKIIADGKVVWSERVQDDLYNYGVQFVSLVPEFREIIEAYVGLAPSAL